MRSVYINCRTAIKGSTGVRSIITLASLLLISLHAYCQTPASIISPSGTTISSTGRKTVCVDTFLLVANSPGQDEGGYWALAAGQATFWGDKTNDSIYIIPKSQGLIIPYWTIGNAAGDSSEPASAYLDYQAPTQPKTANDFVTCTDMNVKLSANQKVIGYPKWRKISGSGSFNGSDSQSDAYVNNLSIGLNVFVYQISNSPYCPTRVDTLKVTNYTPSKAIAGANNPVCSDSTFLQANTPNSPTIGEWRSLAVAPKPSILDPHNPNSKVLNLSAGNNDFVWRTYVDSKYCVDSVKVTINASQQQTALIFGKTFADTALCNERLWLMGNKAQAGSSNTWTLVKGSGSISWPTKDTSWVNALGLGVDSVVYTISNALCGSSKASLRITNNSVTKPISVKDSCFLSPFASLLDLKLKNLLKTGESGQWSLLKVPSPVGISFNPTGLTTASFQPSKSGIYRFRYDAANSFACSSSTVSSYYLITKATLPNDSCVVNGLGAAISVSVKAKQVPRVGEKERGEWTISPAPLSSTKNDSVLSFTAASGVFSVTYSIRNDSCTTCNTACPNSDQMTVTVITKPKINAYTSCFLAASLNLSSNAPASAEVARWRSPSFLLISDTIFSPTQISNIKIGKSIVIRTFSNNGCVASDTAKLTRVTTPNAGRDTCFPSGITNLNYIHSANSFSRSAGEVGQWRRAANSTTLNFNPLPDTIRGVLNDPSKNGVYSLVWGIQGSGCSVVFYDTVKIGLVTKPLIPSDTTFTIPFPTPSPTLAGNTVASNSNETPIWYGPNNLVVSGRTLTMPSLGAGTYLFRYSITDSSKAKMCSFSSTISVTYLTGALIKKTKLDTCVRNLSQLTLEANALPASDSGIWYTDKLKYPLVEVDRILGEPEKSIVYPNGTGKFVVYWKTFSKANGFTSIDSIRITNLTKPIATGSFCAKDTFITISSPATFPVKQPYEKAYWIKKSSGAGTFLKDSLATTIYALKPGQIQLSTVITDKTSACADTSSPIVLTTVTKAKAFDTPYRCLTTTFDSLKANSYASGEKGQWTYKSSSFGVVPIIDNSGKPNAYIHGLGERRTTLRWTIKNIADSSCFSSDSVNSRLVVSSKATVGYQDTCIVGSRTVLLRAIKAKPYEKQGWLRSSTTDTLSRNESFSFANASLGPNSFTWVIYDTTYKLCRSSAVQNATVLNRPQVLDAASCLIKASLSVSDTLISLNDNLSSIKQVWKKDPLFTNDTLKPLPSNTAQLTYRAVFNSTGKRRLIWRDSVSASCFADTTISISVIPKAKASISSSCLLMPLNNDTLKAVAVDGMGIIGKWSSKGLVTIKDKDLAITTVQFLERGKAEFVWHISDGDCQDSTKISAISLSKPKVYGDSCLFYSNAMTANVSVDTISTNETGLWSSFPALVSKTNANLYQVTRLVHGANTLTWKVYSQHNPECADSAKIVLRTFTKSGFTPDTSFICSKDFKFVGNKIGNSNGAEYVTWNLKPSPWKIKKPQATDSVELVKLSNDTTYTLYRHIGNQRGCMLHDSLFVRNHQLDTAWIKPEGLNPDLIPRSYYTCVSSTKLLVNNLQKDISTAQGQWNVMPGKGKLTFNISSSTDDKVVYELTNIVDTGTFTLVWSARNPNSNCPTLKDSIIVERRTGLGRLLPAWSRTVCGNETGLLDFPIYKEAESVLWKAITVGPKFVNDTSNDVKKVVIKNLEPGDNSLIYKVYKGGCQDSTKISIFSQSDSYSIDIQERIVKGCEKFADTLRATHSLGTTISADLHMFWSNNKAGTDTSNLHTLAGAANERVVEITKIKQDTENKFYIVAKNGECPYKYDSVTVYNYSQPNDIKAGLNVTIVCGTTVGIFATKPPLASGKWSIDDSVAVFDNDTDDTTVLRKLNTRDSLYTLKWAVTNGACYNEIVSQFRVSDTISRAIILSDQTDSLCDVNLWHLRAVPPLFGTGKWVWVKGNVRETLTDNVPSYDFKIPEEAKNELYSFEWVVSKKYCENTNYSRIGYFKSPSKANAGLSQSLVTDKTYLAATPPEVGLGEWEVKKSSGVIANKRDPNSEVTNLNFGDNILEWTVRNGTCPLSKDQVVVSFKDFSIPQGFSPNGDSKNDKFEIKGIENYTGTELLVYNRWGREVYSSNNYQNSWDGDGLDEDTYYYVMTLINGRKYTGYVVLKRK